MCPLISGSHYFNSVIFVDVVDDRCCWTAIDVGAYGSEGHSNEFKRFEFGKKITEATI
jgi:hypothetical protein